MSEGLHFGASCADRIFDNVYATKLGTPITRKGSDNEARKEVMRAELSAPNDQPPGAPIRDPSLTVGGGRSTGYSRSVWGDTGPDATVHYLGEVLIGLRIAPPESSWAIQSLSGDTPTAVPGPPPPSRVPGPRSGKGRTTSRSLWRVIAGQQMGKGTAFVSRGCSWIVAPG
jgi:hypothetical protein